MMTVVWWISGLLITGGAVAALIRAERGPSILDRAVAVDVLVLALMAGLALWAAVTQRTDVVPVLVALALVGFVGSVAVARFAAVEPQDESASLREVGRDGTRSDGTRGEEQKSALTKKNAPMNRVPPGGEKTPLVGKDVS